MSIYEIKQTIKDKKIIRLWLHRCLRREIWDELLLVCDEIQGICFEHEEDDPYLPQVLRSIFSYGKLKDLHLFHCDSIVAQLCCDYGELRMFSYVKEDDDEVDDCRWIEFLLERTKLEAFALCGYPTIYQQRRIFNAALNSNYIQVLAGFTFQINIDFDRLKRHVSLQGIRVSQRKEERLKYSLAVAKSKRTKILCRFIWAISKGYFPLAFRDIVRELGSWLEEFERGDDDGPASIWATPIVL